MDSRRFSRNLAVTGLIAGPILMLLGTALSPAWDDNTAKYLQEVADNEAMHYISGLCWLFGAIFMVPGFLGIGRLLRRRRLTPGQVGAGLAVVGLMSTSGWFAIGIMDLAMVDEAANRAEMVALSERAEESAAAAPFFVMFLGGIMLGNLLIAAALFRRKIVAAWVPALMVVHLVASFASEGTRVLSTIGFVLWLAAFAAIALRIRSLSDEQWARWSPLEDDVPVGPVVVTAPDGASRPVEPAVTTSQ